MPLRKLTDAQLRLIKHVAVFGNIRPERGEFAVISSLQKAGLLEKGSARVYTTYATCFTSKLDALLLATFPRYHVDIVPPLGVLFAPGLRVVCCRRPRRGQRDIVGFDEVYQTAPLQIIADLLNKDANL